MICKVQIGNRTPVVGNLVTGTCQHISDDDVDLTVDGQTEPIGVTNSHPFWSVDRQEFVPACELTHGKESASSPQYRASYSEVAKAWALRLFISLRSLQSTRDHITFDRTGRLARPILSFYVRAKFRG